MMRAAVPLLPSLFLLFACSTAPSGETKTGDDGAFSDFDVLYPDGEEPDEDVPDTPLPEVAEEVAEEVIEDTTEPPDIAPDEGGDDPDDGPIVEPGPELPPPNGTPQFSNCSEPGGDRNIYDLQDPQCPDHITPEPLESPGAPVVLKGVIASAVFGDTTFVQEAAGGPYSGIAVFMHGIPPIDIVPGTVLDVTGGYYEFFGLSQIWLESWEIVEQGDAPQPFQVSHPAHVATDGAMAEMMEGVLIRVSDLQTIHTKPDCPNDWGEFLVTGDLRVDDMAPGLWDARLGDQFAAITGALTYTFDNFKLEPRTEADFDVTKKGGASSISKCIESDCIVPETATGTGQIVVNEIMADPFQNDTGQEWIELYNPTDEPVDIGGWQLRDCGGQSFELIGDLTIEPKSTFVLGANANPATNGGVPVDLSYGLDGFYLPNTVGSVILFDGTTDLANVVDQARYSRFDEWESVFVTGHSLERTSPTSDGTKPTSWEPSQSPFGTGENFGTPGE